MSVLDVAMEIGLGGGNNSLQDWIYNNQLVEEEEEFEARLPIAFRDLPFLTLWFLSLPRAYPS